MKTQTITILAGALGLVLACSLALGDTKTWSGGTGDWFVGGNWSPSGVPQAGDDVVISTAGATVSLTNTVPASGSLSSFAISGTATLSFSKWGTCLRAATVTLSNQSILTSGAPFLNGAASNRVWLACSNLLVDTSARIDVSERGYAGATLTFGQGPGGGTKTRAGGGHGGFGGNRPDEGGGRPYGSETLPENPGSSGAYDGATRGGHGGGAVRIDATGDVTINGAIRATGGGGAVIGNAGAGAGGSIYLACRSLSGTAGTIVADGGAAAGVYSASGGGGRIAVAYDPAAQALLPVPGVTLSAKGGGYSVSVWPGDLGTVSLPDARLLTTTPKLSGRLVIPSFTEWNVESLTLSEGWLRLPGPGLRLTVSNDLRVTGSATILELGGNAFLTNRVYRNSSRNYVVYSDSASPQQIEIGGDLVLTNGGRLAVYAGLASPASPDYGARVAVTGSLVIASGSVLYPYSHPTNGGSVLLSVGQLAVLPGGTVDADAAGYAAGSYANQTSANGYGPGASTVVQAGAGYGGAGGNFNNGQGLPYGSLTDPARPGSGSGGASCSGGGGLIRVQVAGTARVDGILTASAGPGTQASGSGGGISIGCGVFRSTGGVLKADGRSDYNIRGGGGGGRIAIRYDPAQQALAPRPSARFSVLPGTNTAHRGDLGTLYFTDNRFLGETLANLTGQLPAVNAWSVDALTVLNSWIRFSGAPVQITVTNDIRVAGVGSRLDVGGGALLTNGAFRIDLSGDNSGGRILYSHNTAALACGGDLVLTNGGRLYLFSGPTNAPFPSCGGTLAVGGDLQVAASSWLVPVSHPTNGGSVFMSARNVVIASGGGIFASGMGCAGGSPNGGRAFGQGAGGTYRGGGGFGGKGGAGGNNLPGPAYGLANAPAACGSGGAAGVTYGYGHFGGGLAWLHCERDIRLDGAILTDGMSSIDSAAAGSGGGILLDCRSLSGGGTLSAKGGNCTATTAAGGSGGGGRIAVWYGRLSPANRLLLYAGKDNQIPTRTVTETVPGFSGPVSVAGGTNGQTYPGQPGSKAFSRYDDGRGTVVLIR